MGVQSLIVGIQNPLALEALKLSQQPEHSLSALTYRKLLAGKSAAGKLTPEDIEVMSSLPIHFMDIRADQDIVREGDRPSRSCILFEGLAAWWNLTAKGKRQILSFPIPGDIPDLNSLHLDVLDATLSTLTTCKVGFVQHEVVKTVCAEYPRIAEFLWRSTLIDAAIFRQWVTNVGGRSAYSRIAHLLCETIVRLQAIGLSDGVTCSFPVTQQELGDATGLSIVHVNRTLKQLREADFLTHKDEKLTILDWAGLVEAAEFEPAYLHLR